MAVFCKRWPAQQHASSEETIEDQYEPLLQMLDKSLIENPQHDEADQNKFDAILWRDCIRIAIAECITAGLEEITINQRWQIVNCFLETCAFEKEHDEAPVFCLEAAGRDDFVVTTYGFAPQQHALFPGVPLQLQSTTDLQYTLVLRQLDPKRRLVLLDPSLPGDAEE
jgi:CDP-diacylglycerol pyrophosphatase